MGSDPLSFIYYCYIFSFREGFPVAESYMMLLLILDQSNRWIPGTILSVSWWNCTRRTVAHGGRLM